MKLDNLKMIVLTVVGIFFVLVVILTFGTLYGGEWQATAQNVATVIIAITVFASVMVGIGVAIATNPAFTVMFFGFAGVVVAFIEKTLYDQGVLASSLAASNVTLTEAMTLTIVVYLLIGCVIGMLRRK